MEAAQKGIEEIIPVGIPLGDVVRAKPTSTPQKGAGPSYLPEPAQERIRPALPLGDVGRFQGFTFPELATWAYNLSIR